MANAEIDLKAIEQLARGIGEMKRRALGRLAERGYQLLREEIKESAYITGNLWQGVAPPDVDYPRFVAQLTVSARSGRRGARQATVYNKRGEIVQTRDRDGNEQNKTVTLKAQKPFNYAETVARGREALLAPKGKAFIVPVSSIPTGTGYLLDRSGQAYVVRTSLKAVAPNPFDERAAARLSREAESIASAVVKEFA